jgi:hypothetical protein
VFTNRQAEAAGCTSDGPGTASARDGGQALGAGVYQLAGSARTWEQHLVAATLGAGPCAAASHRSAAALLGIPGFERRGRPEVTTPRPRRHRGPEAVVHCWRPFPDHHLTVIEGIVTNRVSRTRVDRAGVVHPGRVERAVDNCLAAGVATFGSLQEAFCDLASRGRAGIAVMRGILSARGPLYVAPGGELEFRFLEVVRTAHLPEPVRQLDVGDSVGWIGRVDFAYPDVRALIEVDGRRYHSSLLDQQADARRDAALRAAGWREVVRFGWDDIVRRPETVVARVRRLRAVAA